MNLVEILARELEVWPEDAQELGQWPAGEVCIRASQTGHPCTEVYTSSKIADDVDAWCTRPQWQAERDRMKAMEAPKDARTTPEMIAAWKAAQGKAMPIEQIPEPTYEQQLWDRVASSAIGGIIASNAFHDYASFQGNVTNAVDFASQVADAFMAERAKRVGK